MPHFYVNPKNINNNTFVIDNEQFHYLTNVRRFNVGDTINIFDGLGNSFVAQIEKIEKKQLSGKIISSKTFQLSNKKISLYTAIPKGERFDWLIEKASEIGVYKIIPVIYERSVIKDFTENKIERYRKISMAASSQSWRADIMQITSPLKFLSVTDILKEQKNSLNILPYESEEENKIVSLDFSNVNNINIFIGPEGGFDNKEIELALKNNFKIVTLGKNILRVETAAIVASSIVTSIVN
jgi:16S rRNA (uracil1498-N3)-methyltransferase